MPILNHKILGHAVSATGNISNENTLYTVPPGATAEVKTLVINQQASGSNSGTYRISVSKNGAATTATDYLYYGASISQNSTTTVSNLNLSLSAGDVVRFSCSQTDVSFSLFGTEIYTPAYGVYFDVYENGASSTVRLYGLETNLNYLKYSDEDESLRIGFRGYGPSSELTVDFPSAVDRDTFVRALETARVYGYGFYDSVDPANPLVYIGNNISTDGTTTTSTTTTTTASPTTTTTTIAGTTTSTTTTTTVAGTTTTTTAAPARLKWRFSALADSVDNITLNGIVDTAGETGPGTTAEYTAISSTLTGGQKQVNQGEVSAEFMSKPANVYPSLSVYVSSTNPESHAIRFDLFDVTNPTSPVRVKSNPSTTNPNYPNYYTSPINNSDNGMYFEISNDFQPGRVYLLEVTVPY